MTDLDRKDLPLPAQTEGMPNDVQKSITCASVEEAKRFFQEAKDRLLNINQWTALCKNEGASFQLVNDDGARVEGNAQEGLYIKIDIPGPGPVSGKGFDWVRVEAVEDDDNAKEDSAFQVIRVRPVSDPTNGSGAIAHFFSGKASSNFVVLREGAKITAAVIGRNEVINTDTENSIIDKIRNFFVGAGAKAGIADPQWEKLVAGIVAQQE